MHVVSLWPTIQKRRDVLSIASREFRILRGGMECVGRHDLDPFVHVLEPRPVVGHVGSRFLVSRNEAREVLGVYERAIAGNPNDRIDWDGVKCFEKALQYVILRTTNEGNIRPVVGHMLGEGIVLQTIRRGEHHAVERILGVPSR